MQSCVCVYLRLHTNMKGNAAQWVHHIRSLRPPAGPSFHFSCEKSQHFLKGQLYNAPRHLTLLLKAYIAT